MTSPLSQVLLVYDLEQALASLRAAARRCAAAYLPRDLMCAAVAFTLQLAIESGHSCEQLRALERELIAGIEIETAKRASLGGKIELETEP